MESVEQLIARAMKSEMGIVVQVSDLPSFRRKFYQVRRQHSEFERLSLRLSPHSEGEVFIQKRNVDNEGE